MRLSWRRVGVELALAVTRTRTPHIAFILRRAPINMQDIVYSLSGAGGCGLGCRFATETEQPVHRETEKDNEESRPGGGRAIGKQRNEDGGRSYNVGGRN